MKSSRPVATVLRDTLGGSLPSVPSYPRGALSTAMLAPGLTPSLATSGFLEYPATSAALCRPLPPLTALVHHPPDPPRGIVRDVQRPVRPLGQPHGPMLRPRAVLVPEPDRKRLIGPDRLAVLEGHEHDAIARLGQGSAVPRAGKRDERATAILSGELRARVEHQAVRRPMAWERDRRLLLLRAPPHLFAVAAVFRSEDQVAKL